MGVVEIFIKVFGLTVILFLGVLGLFVYPTNRMYEKEDLEPRGEPNILLIWSSIMLAFITVLLYFYYHLGNSYLCSISSYFACAEKINIAVYVLMFIHLLAIFIFSLFFTNKLAEVIKSKKLDIYLFAYASLSIFLVLFNYQIYEVLFKNEKLLYLFVRIFLYLVTYAPIYSFFIITLFVSPIKIEKKKKKKKDKKKTKKK